MTIWGHCLQEAADVLVTADRRCVNDGSLVIPASFGQHTQQWRDGNWHPEIPRPEGYVYVPKQWADPKPAAAPPNVKRYGAPQRPPPPRQTVAAPKRRTRPASPTPPKARRLSETRTCRVCSSRFYPTVTRGVVQACCSLRCAALYRTHGDDAAAVRALWPTGNVTCPICGATFKPKQHGNNGWQKYCSRVCMGQAQAARAAVLPDGICPSCGATFSRNVKNGARKQSCSRKCAGALTWARQRQAVAS